MLNNLVVNICKTLVVFCVSVTHQAGLKILCLATLINLYACSLDTDTTLPLELSADLDFITSGSALISIADASNLASSTDYMQAQTIHKIDYLFVPIHITSMVAICILQGNDYLSKLNLATFRAYTQRPEVISCINKQIGNLDIDTADISQHVLFQQGEVNLVVRVFRRNNHQPMEVKMWFTSPDGSQSGQALLRIYSEYDTTLDYPNGAFSFEYQDDQHQITTTLTQDTAESTFSYYARNTLEDTEDAAVIVRQRDGSMQAIYQQHLASQQMLHMNSLYSYHSLGEDLGNLTYCVDNQTLVDKNTSTFLLYTENGEYVAHDYVVLLQYTVDKEQYVKYHTAGSLLAKNEYPLSVGDSVTVVTPVATSEYRVVEEAGSYALVDADLLQLHENSPLVPLELSTQEQTVSYLGYGLLDGMPTDTNILGQQINLFHIADGMQVADIYNNTYLLKAWERYQRHPIVATNLCAQENLGFDNMPDLPTSSVLSDLDLGQTPYVRLD